MPYDAFTQNSIKLQLELSGGKAPVVFECYAGSDIETMEKLIEDGWPVDDDIIDKVIVSGDLKCIQWLIDHGFAFTEKTFHLAATRGGTTRCELLLKNGCERDDADFDAYMKRK